jgi:hypothetical protein
MVDFISFFVVLMLLSGSVCFIVATLRAASESVLAALNGTPATCTTLVTLPRRPIRQLCRASSPHYVPLRAAA